jgi:hypothetical protein
MAVAAPAADHVAMAAVAAELNARIARFVADRQIIFILFWESLWQSNVLSPSSNPTQWLRT